MIFLARRHTLRPSTKSVVMQTDVIAFFAWQAAHLSERDVPSFRSSHSPQAASTSWGRCNNVHSLPEATSDKDAFVPQCSVEPSM